MANFDDVFVGPGASFAEVVRTIEHALGVRSHPRETADPASPVAHVLRPEGGEVRLHDRHGYASEPTPGRKLDTYPYWARIDAPDHKQRRALATTVYTTAERAGWPALHLTDTLTTIVAAYPPPAPNTP